MLNIYTSGIGLDIANRLSKEEIYVFGLDINLNTQSLFKFYQCDVSNEQSIISIIDTIISQTSQINYLINAAGVLSVNKKCLIKDIKLDDWNRMLSNNLTSMFLMMKYTYSLLKKSKNACIINISSDQSYKGQVGFAPYGVSKAGINRLTQIAALEFKCDNIRVNAIAPSAVKTNILSCLFSQEEINQVYTSQTDGMKKILTPEDITNMVCFLISDKASKITGKTFDISMD